MNSSRYLPWRSFNEFFISIVYFVQGSAGITAIASAVILRETLGLDFYQMGLIGVAGTLPWMIKPVYGLLTDLVPIGKFRRKPYLHIGPLIGFLGYLLIAFFGTSFESFFLLLVLANLGLALTDVATDGFVVEESNEDNVTRIQGITQASIRVAAFITSFFSGLLIYADILTPNQMYLLAAAFPLITFIASFFIHEKPVDRFSVTESRPADSFTLESSREHQASRKLDLQIFSTGYIASLIIIFVLILLNIAFSGQITAWFEANLPGISKAYLTSGIWLLFGIWMTSYFVKLKKLSLTTNMIFIAILFILLWRINPGTGSSMFFYVKDTLGVNEKTLGFIDTIAQIGSIIGVLLAVKYFNRIRLKPLLFWTVIIAASFGLTSFAITRPEWAQWLGSTPLFSWIGVLLAIPVYFCDSLFNWLFAGEAFANPITTAMALAPLEKFLYVQSIVSELIFMIAYIPLLKLAVLITPKKAEATNYAIIASVMNIGLAISSWLSGVLYNHLMTWFHPELEVSAVSVDIIEILIWVNIITTLTCLLVLPLIKTEGFALAPLITQKRSEYLNFPAFMFLHEARSRSRLLALGTVIKPILLIPSLLCLVALELILAIITPLYLFVFPLYALWKREYPILFEEFYIACLRQRYRIIAYFSCFTDKLPTFDPYSTHHPLQIGIEHEKNLSFGPTLLTLLVFPKLIVLIPHLVARVLLYIPWIFVVLLNPIMVLVLGKVPKPLEDFFLEFLRLEWRIQAFFFGFTSHYPPVWMTGEKRENPLS